MHYVILRDDDTNALTPPACLERLYRPFLERNLPVNLATIPEVRTDVKAANGQVEGFITAGNPAQAPLMSIADSRDIVTYLQSESGYRIVHHGCHHDLYEFGATDRAELVRRLDHGAEEFRKAGFEKPRAFVAPYDRLSREAYVETAARFPVISTGWFEADRIPLRWWPCYAKKKFEGRPHWQTHRTTLLSHPGCLLSFHRPYSEMFANVRRAVEGATLTVLVTHWWEYFRDRQADNNFISVLHEVADWLGSAKDVRVVSFDDVANGAVPLN